MGRIASPQQLEKRRNAALAQRPKDRLRVSVCGGTGCQAAGCKEVAGELKKQLDQQGLSDDVHLTVTGCHGFCEQGPIIVIRPEGLFYPKVKSSQVGEIVQISIAGGEPIKELLYQDPASGERIVHEHEIPFYAHQQRLIFGDNGEIAPVSLDDYLAVGGYKGLRRALFEMTPDQVIEEVTASGLRGRGGGGFVTGWKWEGCRAAQGQRKFVICNADEGDPGAFMDRSLLEGNPHAVIEGMLIGAYAVGAEEGYVYVRHEYPLAVTHLAAAMEQARAAGLLGETILDSNLNFDITLSRGGGAFVCGESTALMASLEGRPGEPRAKYVHTVEHGLYDQPTTLNNVETWANVPLILREGAESYAAVGTEHSKGTKIFSLVGKINNTGLVEVPMGVTLREVIESIGGGIPAGRRFKAVQTGGPSGGCLPESMLDLPVDFQELTRVGSMMGSGGMIVMDDQTCMVDVARYFVGFLYKESCGKCTPCREGLRTCLGVLDRIVDGKGQEQDLKLLEEIGEWMTTSSLCALGGSAANPVLSTLQYFRDEYVSHIQLGRCPAGVCKALITYSIDSAACDGCGACAMACPSDCISGERKSVHVIDADACIKCGACLSVCPKDAVVRR